MEVLFLKPQYKAKIWGGSFFRDRIDPHLPADIGEMWIVSAHREGDLEIASGPYAGLTLAALYKDHPKIFNYPAGSALPLLLKIIAPADDLSVQVHPDDAYAQAHEDDSGKTECWLMLEAEEGAGIILGHKAADGEDFLRLAREKGFREVLCRREVKRGDFYPLPAGVVHAAGKGIVFLEVQQSSDLTYRIYDYDRRDQSGQMRELHLDKARDVIKNLEVAPKTGLFTVADEVVELWDNPHFCVVMININENFTFPLYERAVAAAVIEGELTVSGKSLAFGSGFIVPALTPGITAKGYGRLVLAIPKF